MIVKKMSKIFTLILFLNFFLISNANSNSHSFELWLKNFKKQADAYLNDLRALDKEITDANELTRGLNKEQLQKKIAELHFSFSF